MPDAQRHLKQLSQSLVSHPKTLAQNKSKNSSVVPYKIGRPGSLKRPVSVTSCRKNQLLNRRPTVYATNLIKFQSASKVADTQ